MKTSPSSPSAFQGDTDTVYVAAAMRSGQTWLCFMLAHALNARFLEPYCLLRGIVYTGHDYVRGLTQGRQAERDPTSYALVVKTHECPDPYFSLTRRVILIVRDPRDTITSAALRFHVMTTTGSDVEEDAQQLSLLAAPLDKPGGLKQRLWRLVYGNRLLGIVMTARKWRAFHEAWLQVPFCHVVRFEDLVREPVPTLQKICRYLEIELPEAQLRETALKLSMQEISKHHANTDASRRIGFRKGIVGDFKNHLSRLEIALVRHFCRKTAARFQYDL